MKGIRPSHPAYLLGTVILILVLTILSLVPAPQCLALLPANGNQDQGQAPEHYRDRVVRDLKHAIARVQPLLERYGYPAVFLAIMVEGMGLLAPGQTLLMAAAFAAAQGRLDIVWVLFWAFTAAVAGNSLGYLIGRWGGRPLLRKIKVNEQHLARMEEYFSRGGKWVVLMARFFEGLRQLNGIVAGLLKMPWQVFTSFNILGAALWTGVWGLGVYFLDKEIVSLHLTLHQIKPWVAAFCLLAFLALLGYLLLPGRKNLGGGPGNLRA
jgi:membrane protein DedA with SNARE-associated domain